MAGAAASFTVSAGNRVWLFGACVLAGALPLCARWIADAPARTLALAAITAGYAAIAILCARRAGLRPYSPLIRAFLVLALVQCGNELVRTFSAGVLHQPPKAGDPLASTVAGTVVVQLLETFVAIILALGLTRMFDRHSRLTWFGFGKGGVWLAVSIVLFGFLLVGGFRHADRFIPMNHGLPRGRYLSLLPIAALLAISNGFQEEFLFRGLFLRRYACYFPFWAALALQSVVFGIAHLAVTYSTSAVLFTLMFAVPLGLIAGLLMQATKGILTPSIFHAGFDIPIYLAFLSFAS